MGDPSPTRATGAIPTPADADDQKPADQPVAVPSARLTEAEAIRIASAPMANWSTMGTQALDAMYTADAIGFEPNTAPLIASGAAFAKVNKDLLAMKFDKVKALETKVQILSDDVFILTTCTDMTSTDGPVKSTTWRCTGVFQRQPDGKFRMVNEHCSYPPKS